MTWQPISRSRRRRCGITARARTARRRRRSSPRVAPQIAQAATKLTWASGSIRRSVVASFSSGIGSGRRGRQEVKFSDHEGDLKVHRIRIYGGTRDDRIVKEVEFCVDSQRPTWRRGFLTTKRSYSDASLDLIRVHVYHDEWRAVHNQRDCNCDPDIEMEQVL
jgi:hypothetical protein